MKNKDFILGALFGAVLAGAVFFFLEYSGVFDSLKPRSSAEKPYMLVSGIFALFAALTIHELGHLLTALALGFRFQLFVVGLLGVRRTDDDRIKIYLNTDMHLSGGVAAALPVDFSADNKKKFAYVLIAGPLASLIAGGLCIAIATMIDNSWRFFFAITGLASIGIFFATTIPGKSGVFFTDRKRFQRLMKRGKTSEIEAALLELTAIQTVTKSAKNFDPRKIELIKSDNEPVMQYIGSVFAHDYYSETGDEEKARLEKERMSELSVRLPKGLVRMMSKADTRNN